MPRRLTIQRTIVPHAEATAPHRSLDPERIYQETEIG